MLLEIVRHALGLGHVGLLHLGHLAGAFDAPLDVADGAEVLVELALVTGAEVRLEAVGIVLDEVEDAPAIGIALGALAIWGGAEEAFEDELGIDFLGKRRGRGLPGDAGKIDARVAGIAVAGHAALFAADFKRRQACLIADAVGSDLVDGDAGTDVGAVGLAWLGTREERCERAGVVAGAVAVG